MPRKKKPFIEPAFAVKFFLTLVGIWFVFTLLSNISAGAVVLPVLAFGVIVISLILMRKSQRNAARGSLHSKANAAIEHYAPELARRWLQLVRQDAYGKLQLDKWAKE